MADIDPTVAQLLSQGAFNQYEEFKSSMNRHRDGNNHVVELLRNVAVQATQLVGAKAAESISTDALAKAILDQRSARDQPTSSAFANPVKTA